MNTAIFDMDGLLVDTEILYVTAFKEVCQTTGHTFDDSIFKSCIGTTHKSQKDILFNHYGESFDFEKNHILTNEIFDKYILEGRLDLKAGVIEILEMFKKNNFKIALASSNSTKNVFRTLKLKNIEHYFDEIITGDMVSQGKPSPEIFLKACEKLGSKPEKSYVFEDSYNGVRAGFDGGFTVIMVPDLLEPDGEMQEKCAKIINSLLDFTLELS